MGRTSIEWTRGDDGTEGRNWQVSRGCSRVSPGCGDGSVDGAPAPGGGCYAEAIAARFCGTDKRGRQLPFYNYATEDGWTRKVSLLPENLGEPFTWRDPSRVFVNSMSDLFHEALTNEEIAAVFGVMAASPRHVFQCLTKRSRRAREWFAWVERAASLQARSVDFYVQNAALKLGIKIPLHAIKGTIKSYNWPLQNVHLGVSVESQRYADERIPDLLACPAAVRWLSCEPLLGPVTIDAHQLGPVCTACSRHPREHADTECPAGYLRPGIEWIVVGSESGKRARPMDIAWARSLVDQCVAAGVPVFVKQIATPEGAAAGNPKGGDPQFWPPGSWPRQFPSVQSALSRSTKRWIECLPGTERKRTTSGSRRS